MSDYITFRQMIRAIQSGSAAALAALDAEPDRKAPTLSGQWCVHCTKTDAGMTHVEGCPNDPHQRAPQAEQPAPVPPPDSISLAQHEAAPKSLSDAMGRTHEAALVEARREERERCARACFDEHLPGFFVGPPPDFRVREDIAYDEGVTDCTRAIRALPDASEAGAKEVQP